MPTGDGSRRTEGDILYRDAIHLDIPIAPLAEALLDTPEFQRLGGINQLGFVELVYREGTSKRFNHSVGTYHKARQIVLQLERNHKRLGLQPVAEALHARFGKLETGIEALSEIVGLAALLHDVTHMPHGHALEDEFQDLYLKHDDLKSLRLWYLLYSDHSSIAQLFGRSEPWLAGFTNRELRDLIFLILKYRHKVEENRLSDFSSLLLKAVLELESPRKARLVGDSVAAREMLQQLEGLYHTWGPKGAGVFHPFMSDVISNTLCADLIDYSVRDIRNTGLVLAADPKVEQYFVVLRDHLTNELHLTIRMIGEKGPRLDITSTVLDWMSLRYSLAERVYYHKTKVAADVMLAHLLKMVPPPPDNCPYPSSTNPPKFNWRYRADSVLAMRDADLFEYIRNQAILAGNDAAERLLEMIEYRRLYKAAVIIPKYVADEELRIFPALYQKFRDEENPTGASENRAILEKRLNSLFGDSFPHALLFCPSDKMQAKAVETFAEVEAGKVVPLNIGRSALPPPIRQRLESVENSYRYLWKMFLFLHPDDAANEVVSHAVAVDFCSSLNEDFGLHVSLESAKSFFPSGFQTPKELVDAWYQSNQHRIHPELVRALRDLTQVPHSWALQCIGIRNQVEHEDGICEYLHATMVVKMYADSGLPVSGALDRVVEALGSVDAVVVAARKNVGLQRERLTDLPYYGKLKQNGLV